MPKLLQLNSSVGCGSTGRIAETIASLARERGWDCYIAHGSRYKGKTEMRSFQVSGKATEYAHYAKSILFDAHGLGSRQATKRLVSWINHLQPDVIQIHNIHGYWINYEILFRYLKKSGIPVVWTFHDCWAITGHCAMFTSTFCDKWQTECSHCPHLDWYPKSIFHDGTRRNYHRKKNLFASMPNLTIVTVSNWLKEIVGQSYLKEIPLRVIPNGIDLSVFHPRPESTDRIREKYGLGDKTVVISVADKWHEGIGFSDIPKLRTLLDNRFVIVVVGVTQEQKHSLPDGVIGILHTSSQDELAELYSAADISFTPQTIATFGLVSVESMACGTPAVVYAPAAAEVIAGNGFMVPARDIQQLASTLVRFVEEGGKVKYRESCIRRVVSEYDQRINYSKYIDLYESLLG